MIKNVGEIGQWGGDRGHNGVIGYCVLEYGDMLFLD